MTELADALADWTERSPEGTASVETVDGEVRFESCDPDADATGGGSVSPELLALPASRTQIFTAATDGGLPADVVRCYVDDLLGSLSFDQLMTDELTPEIESVIADAQRRCF